MVKLLQVTSRKRRRQDHGNSQYRPWSCQAEQSSCGECQTSDPQPGCGAGTESHVVPSLIDVVEGGWKKSTHLRALGGVLRSGRDRQGVAQHL